MKTNIQQNYWSFKEKTFVNQSLGTLLEILTKILCFTPKHSMLHFWGGSIVCFTWVSASVHAGIHTSSWEQTLPLKQTPPLEQTPPQSGHPMGADTPWNSACWEIQTTSGRYASYWNAILFLLPLLSLCECYNLLPWYPFFPLPSWMGIEPICHVIRGS